MVMSVESPGESLEVSTLRATVLGLCVFKVNSTVSVSVRKFDAVEVPASNSVIRDSEDSKTSVVGYTSISVVMVGRSEDDGISEDDRISEDDGLSEVSEV